MKNKGLLGLLAVLGILFFWGCNVQRGLVSADEDVKEKWGKVESAYQARLDKLPNLEATVKGVANFEKGTLEAVIAARASATQMKVDAKDLTPENIEKYQASQGQLSQALGRLMVVSEQYPQLKANESFNKLMDEISGTENRIKTERDRFNEAVKPFNIKVRQFPGSIFAGMFGFKEKGFFKADPKAAEAPKMNFENKTDNK
jgi:LemA protein